MIPQGQIPGFLEHLPIHKGLPVPYTIMWVDGIPDFRVVDHARVRECVMQRLCGVCGKRMIEYVWFVGGPQSLENSNLFSDPPMHEACARFAIKWCPFLNGTVTHSNQSRPIPKEAGEIVLTTPERSHKIGMRKTKAFELLNVSGHGMMRVHKWYGRPVWLA